MPAAQDLFNALRRNPTVKGLPDVNTFEKALQNPDKAGQIYDMLSKNPTIKGLPSKDIFINKFSPKQPQAQPARQEVPASIAKPVPSTVAKPVPTQAQPQQQPNVGERIVQAEVGKAQLEQPQATPQPTSFERIKQNQIKAQQNIQQGLTPQGDKPMADVTFEEFQERFTNKPEANLNPNNKFDLYKIYEKEKSDRKGYAEILSEEKKAAEKSLEQKFGAPYYQLENALKGYGLALKPFEDKAKLILPLLEQLKAEYEQASTIPDEAKRMAAQDAAAAKYNATLSEYQSLEEKYSDKLNAYRDFVDSEEYKKLQQINQNLKQSINKYLDLEYDEKYNPIFEERRAAQKESDIAYREGEFDIATDVIRTTTGNMIKGVAGMVNAIASPVADLNNFDKWVDFTVDQWYETLAPRPSQLQAGANRTYSIVGDNIVLLDNKGQVKDVRTRGFTPVNRQTAEAVTEEYNKNKSQYSIVEDFSQSEGATNLLQVLSDMNFAMKGTSLITKFGVPATPTLIAVYSTQMYDNFRDEAIRAGMKPDAANKYAIGLAALISSVETVASPLERNILGAGAKGTFKGRLTREIVDAVNSGKMPTADAVKFVGKNFLKEGLSEVKEELVYEPAVQSLYNAATNVITGKELDTKTFETGKDALVTAGTVALTTAFFSGANARRAIDQYQSDLFKFAVENPEIYQQVMEDKLRLGYISQDLFKENMKNYNDARKGYQFIESNVQGESNQNKAFQLYMQKMQNDNLAANAITPELKRLYEENSNKISAEINKIVLGEKQAESPNIQEYAAEEPVKTMQDELQVGDTVEMSPEVTTAQSDTERRSRKSNKNQLNEIGSNKFVKLNKEGENTELSDVELKLINSLIDKMISQGKSAKEINTELNRRGFIQSQATTPAQIERYLQSRIDGKINAKVGESISQEINAKYDAELAALEQEQPITEPIKTEKDAEEQQSGQMRVQSEQRQTEGASDSDMPSVNEAGLPIGETIKEEIKPVTDEKAEEGQESPELRAEKEEKRPTTKRDGDDLILKHGTPHDFSKFELEKIGTGEGAQAFGYGLYFTDGSKIAEQYAKKLSEDKTGIVYEVRIKDGFKKEWAEWREPLEQDVEDKLYGSLTDEERAQYETYIDNSSWDNDHVGVFDELKRDEDGLETYDKPSAVGLIYRDLRDAFGQQKATEIFKRAGIDGIKYRSNSGRGDNFNYVVFDPNSIEITKKEKPQSPKSQSKQEVVEERFTVNNTEYIKRGDEYFSKPSKGKEKPITQKVFENAKAKVKQADEGVNISDLEIRDEKVLSEIPKLPLSHVSGLSMRPDQAVGTYLSTEKAGNRYAKGGKKAKAAKVKIKKPYITNDTGNLELRKRILTNNPTAFTQEDFAMYEVPKGRFGIDDLNDTGIRKLAQLTTDYLKSKGYDSIYFPESKTQEGELIVFDKENVEIEQDANETFSYTKGGFSYILRKYGQGKDAKYTRQLKGEGNKEVPIDASVYAEQKGKADRRSSRSRQAYESRTSRAAMKAEFDKISQYDTPETYIVNMLARGLKVPISVIKEIYDSEQELKAYSAIIDKTQDDVLLDKFAEGLQFDYVDTRNANKANANRDFRDAFISALSVGTKPVDFMAEAVHIFREKSGEYDVERFEINDEAEAQAELEYYLRRQKTPQDITDEEISEAMAKEAEEYLNSLSPSQLTELQNFLNEQAEYERADKGLERNVGQAETKSVPSRQDSGEKGVSQRPIGSNEKRAIKRLEDAKKALEAKQKALEDKRNSIRKQQAKESQFDIFGKPKQAIEADLDVSERNIQSAIRPFAIEVENAKQEVRKAEKAVLDARKSDEAQGELFAPTVSEPVSKAATEAQPQAEKGVGETVQQGAAATRQPTTEAPLTDVEATAKALEGVFVKGKEVEAPTSFVVDLAEMQIPDEDSESFKELKNDIKTNGIKNPIKITFYRGDGKYAVTDGNHRLIAAKELGIKNIPIEVNESSADSKAAFPYAEYPEIYPNAKNPSKNLSEISEAYHKAKADGTNPELVQAVEELLGQKPSPSVQAQPQATDVEATAKEKRFEAGKKLTKEEKREVLKGLKDAYWVNQRPYTIEDTESGERKVYLDEAADYMETSDITGRKLRWFIELPDGRIAHPTEVYGEVSNSEVQRQAEGIERADRDNERNYKKATELIKDKERVADILAKNIEDGNISIRDSRGDYNEIILQRVVFPNNRSYTLSVLEYINNITDEQAIPNEVNSDQVDWGRFISEYSTNKQQATDVATIFESVAQAYADMKNMKPKDARAKKAEIKETLKANPKADFIFTNWNKLKKQLKFTTKGDCP